MKIFLYSSSVYSCHLFLISSASLLDPYHFCLYWGHLCMTCSLGISNFLEEISSFSHSIAFLCFFAWLLRKACLSLLAIFGTLHSDGYIFPFLFFLLLCFFSQLFIRPPQTTILPFCISFSWGCFWSQLPRYKPPSIILQALCLSDRIPWIYLSLSLYSVRDLI